MNAFVRTCKNVSFLMEKNDLRESYGMLDQCIDYSLVSLIVRDCRQNIDRSLIPDIISILLGRSRRYHGQFFQYSLSENVHGAEQSVQL